MSPVGVPHYYDYGEEHGYRILALEHLGVTLGKVHSEHNKKFDPGLAADIGIQMVKM
jgi:hypothetical protein